MFKEILTELYKWSEVWAMLIPLIVWMKYRPGGKILQPVVIYVWSGFILYLLADLSWRTKEHVTLPAFLNDNNFIYNILSILRVLLFSWYFINLKESALDRFKPLLPAIFIAFLIYNFYSLEKFKVFSNNTHAAEVIVLLIFCTSYFIHILLSEETEFTSQPSFWIVTGLFIYEATNLFVFILYSNLSKTDAKFAFSIWHVHNVAMVIFCILVAKGLFESKKPRP